MDPFRPRIRAPSSFNGRVEARIPDLARALSIGARIALIVVGLAAAGPAFADSARLVPAGPAPFGAPRAHLESEDVAVRVRGSLAQIAVRQSFHGVVPRPEGWHVVVPIDPAVPTSDVRVLVDGAAVDASRHSGPDARAWLIDAIARTRRRDLARLWGRDLLIGEVDPLADRTSRSVEVRRDARVASSGGSRTYLHRFGADPRDRADGTAYRVAVAFEGVDASMPLWSPTHDLTLASHGPDHREATATGRLDASSGPFVLAWGEGGPGGTTLLVTCWPTGDAAGWFACVVDSSASASGPPLARTLLLVIDATASMQGAAMERVRRAVHRVVASLRPDDRLMVVAYGASVVAVPPAPSAADAATRRQVLTFIDALRTGGGGDLGAALDMALGAPRDPAHVTHLVLVCDGRPLEGETDDAALLARVSPRPGEPPVSIHPIAVGVDAPSALLDRLALATRGVPTTVAPGEDPGLALERVARRLGRLWLAEAQVDLGAIAALDIEPPADALPDLALGERTVLFGRYRRPGVVDIVLHGREGSTRRERHQLHQVAAPGEGLACGAIEQIAAWRRAAHLVDRLRLDASDDAGLVEELVRLGVRHGVVTEITASLADPLAPPSGRVDAHVAPARELLGPLRSLGTGAAAMAQARANARRRSVARVASDDLELVVSAPGGRDLRSVHLSGVRSAGGRTFFRRRDEGWVEGVVSSTEGIETIRPDGAEFADVLDALGPSGIEVFTLDGPLVLRVGSRVVRIAGS